METSELLKKVRKIEIRTKGLTKHIFSGEYHSAFKGRGMSFSEVREYQYGDDVRNIDWNVTARTGGPHVKIFEEERELTVMLLLDISGSSFFGTTDRFKNEIITEIAAVLAFSAITNNDKVGAILFSDRIEKYLPPKKGKQNILRIIRELLYIQPSGKSTDITQALEYLNNTQKKRAICFLISDFKASGYNQALQIAAKKHDVIGLRIFDEREKELPDVGLIWVQDSETGAERILDTSDKDIRSRYHNRYEKVLTEFKTSFAKAKSDQLSINTSDDYLKSLHHFFKKRSK
ncbi:MAG: DUF58 domain-containing protein [Saprospiraceae bacterium]|nr:DUF58 domain-containing protein [Saprospiraceae bacterium]